MLEELMRLKDETADLLVEMTPDKSDEEIGLIRDKVKSNLLKMSTIVDELGGIDVVNTELGITAQ